MVEIIVNLVLEVVKCLAPRTDRRLGYLHKYNDNFENLNIIGVYEMCGIGKTTLVKEVARLVRQDKLFDHDEKKILIVLDNVWKHVYLDTVGIPFRDDHKDVNYC
ncbi:hypothetical protein WN943_007610 [Citrus x changshan-huyou]